MALLDSNIVIISLPSIVRQLPDTSTFDGIWIIMGYILINATLLLSFGRLADIYGRVRLYNIGLQYSRLHRDSAAYLSTVQAL